MTSKEESGAEAPRATKKEPIRVMFFAFKDEDTAKRYCKKLDQIVTEPIQNRCVVAVYVSFLFDPEVPLSKACIYLRDGLIRELGIQEGEIRDASDKETKRKYPSKGSWKVDKKTFKEIIFSGNLSTSSNFSKFSKFSKFSDLNLQENLELLNTPDSIYSNLNQGVHKDLWYYGKLIKYRDGLRETVVTSDKVIFVNKSEGVVKGISIGCNEITECLGIEYQTVLEETKNFWSNNSIHGWIQGKNSQNKKEIFTEIREMILKYMDLQDDAEADVVVCFIFGTYCYELFESYPILFLNARRESGKSKLKRLIRLMSFHGEEASNISEASFFRSIEATKGALCIDEYEKIDTDRKKLTDQLLNAGIEKGSSVKRVEKVKGVLRNRSFDVFAPKVVCNISGLNQVTLSRCILIRLLKTLTKKGNLRPKEKSKQWQRIRDGCHIVVMNHWKEIEEVYENHNSEHIKNRKEDVWKPLLSIAKFFGPDIYRRIDEYSKQSIKDSVIDLYESDWEFQLLETLKENIQEEDWYSVKSIVCWLRPKLAVEKPPGDRWVGGQLKRTFLFRQRYNPSSQYYISPELVEDRFKRLYGELKGDESNTKTGNKGVTKETKATKAPPRYIHEKVKTIENIISELCNSNPEGLTSLSDIEIQGQVKKIDRDETSKILQELKTKGILYEPKHGYFKFTHD